MKNKISMEELKKILFGYMGKDKLLIIVLVGVLLIIISLPTKSSNTDNNTPSSSIVSQGISNNTSEYEEYLETKIEKMLGKVEGVGSVKVMVTLKATSEKVLVSQDTYSESIIKETDSDGGVRESSEKSESESYLYSDTGSGSQPYVSKEIKPEVEGVIVIAQGGSDGTVISNVTKAVSALLDVPVNKIQVLKMQQ